MLHEIQRKELINIYYSGTKRKVNTESHMGRKCKRKRCI